MKYKLNTDGTYQIVGKTYTENGITYTISSTATQEQLEAIGVFEVQKKPLQDGFQYSTDTEIIDGVVYYKQVEIPIMPVPDNRILNEMTFNPELCLDDLFKEFNTKIVLDTEFAARNAAIIKLIERKGFKGLNDVSKGLKQIGILDENEYQTFLAIFSKQNIDLTNY